MRYNKFRPIVPSVRKILFTVFDLKKNLFWFKIVCKWKNYVYC